MKDAGLPYSKDSLPDKFLENYPLSSFKNIITVEDFPFESGDDDSTKRKNGVSALYSMRRFIIETLIEAFNEENDLQIKAKIAYALGKLPPQGKFPNTSEKCTCFKNIKKIFYTKSIQFWKFC